MPRHTSPLVALLAALLLPGALEASAPEASELSRDLAPPEPLYKVDPAHPPSLFKRGVEGDSVIIASVDPFGSVHDPYVEQASHEEFGMAALLAASEWIFEPATREGVPVAMKVKIPFQFRLSSEHKLNVELGRLVFQKLDVPVIPSFELPEAPLPTSVPAFAAFYPEEFKNTGKTAAARVEFIIDPQGNVINPRIISVSTPGFEAAALRAAAHMRYKPILVEGQPVYVATSLPIQFSP